ncbi:condensation domain-containing protein [Streptomyces sp. ME19-01-6]|uniref:condensation domain-containing protein n=1 Tax=Streptomyces sp. ME19-01-6 TaxID=3028686 RepID=UPI00299F9F2B|nr:condensation domain-containing protein [Streptomyces sp. ME19-01-6]MDX3228656.1 condensation domain-containing protein [Streptomyces sp. ME19-01-6]
MEQSDGQRQVIEFRGEGSGTYDLTWSQKQVCRWMEQTAPHFANMNLGLLLELPRGADVADATAALRLLIERHEALRTRIHLDGSGVYRQIVHARGRLPVALRECATDEDARSVLADMEGMPFTAVEWPLRVALLLSGGRVTRIAFALSHTATDGWGKEVIQREMIDLISSPPDQRAEILRRPVVQPREQAARERADGGSAARVVEDYWAGQLRRFPNDRFPVPQRPAESPRFPEVMMASPAAASAIARIAEQHQVTPHTAVVGALSVLLSAISHSGLATFRLFCTNRLSEASRSSLGNFYQVVPVTVEVGELPFREVLGNSWKASMTAYHLGSCDPDRLAELTDALSRDRGVHPDLECFINLHGSRTDSPGAMPDGSPEERDSTRIRANGGLDIWEPGKFYVDVWRVSQEFVVSLWGDTALFPSDVLSDCLRCLEHILLRVADDGELTAGKALQGAVRPLDVPLQPGLEYIDGCWVDLAEVRRAIVDCLAPRSVKVVPEGDVGGADRTITAYLELDRENPTARDVHRLVGAGIKGRRFAMAPHRYVIEVPQSAQGARCLPDSP